MPDDHPPPRAPASISHDTDPASADDIARLFDQVLVPELQPGDIVIMDNLGSHQGAGICAAIEAVGARLLYLPPYSPGFNPIENAFAQLKAILRKAAERSVDGLWAAIGAAVSAFSPQDAPTTSPPLAMTLMQPDWKML